MWFFSGFMYHKSLESSQSPFHFISSGIGSTHVLAIELSSVFFVCVCVCVSLIYIFETQFEAQIRNKCVNSGRSNAQQQQQQKAAVLRSTIGALSIRLGSYSHLGRDNTHSHTHTHSYKWRAWCIMNKLKQQRDKCANIKQNSLQQQQQQRGKLLTWPKHTFRCQYAGAGADCAASVAGHTQRK